MTKWKDGEADYCAWLVETQGNVHVPRSAVESYLELQLDSVCRSLGFARLHGDKDWEAIAYAGRESLFTSILKWARILRESA